MLRTATRPRWLGLLALAVLVATLGVLLGRWQWGAAHDTARVEAVREVQSRPVLALDDVLAPHESFPDDGSGQRVRATGEYVPGDGFLVVDRLLDGTRGAWVVEHLVVTSTGANLPVVRGWLPEGEEAPAVPTGEVEVVASLAPGEAPDTRTDLPAGQAGSIDLGRLVNAWSGELYNGFGFVVSETDAGGDEIVAADPLRRVPPPLPDTSIDWRNASYAAQWYVVAAFALWLWWRMLRQEVRREREAAGRAADPDPTPDPTPAPTPGEP